MELPEDGLELRYLELSLSTGNDNEIVQLFFEEFERAISAPRVMALWIAALAGLPAGLSRRPSIPHRLIVVVIAHVMIPAAALTWAKLSP
jgi:hypothetical protein